MGKKIQGHSSQFSVGGKTKKYGHGGGDGSHAENRGSFFSNVLLFSYYIYISIIKNLYNIAEFN